MKYKMADIVDICVKQFIRNALADFVRNNKASANSLESADVRAKECHAFIVNKFAEALRLELQEISKELKIKNELKKTRRKT